MADYTNLTYKKRPFTEFTNCTTNKKGTQALLQELEAQEEAFLEDLLQSIKHQEEFFQDLSPDAQIARIEQLTDQMKKELEEYLYG